MVKHGKIVRDDFRVTKSVRHNSLAADYRKDLKKCFGTSKESFWTIVRDKTRLQEKSDSMATFLPPPRHDPMAQSRNGNRNLVSELFFESMVAATAIKLLTIIR